MNGNIEESNKPTEVAQTVETKLEVKKDEDIVNLMNNMDLTGVQFILKSQDNKRPGMSKTPSTSSAHSFASHNSSHSDHHAVASASNDHSDYPHDGKAVFKPEDSFSHPLSPSFSRSRSQDKSDGLQASNDGIASFPVIETAQDFIPNRPPALSAGYYSEAGDISGDWKYGSPHNQLNPQTKTSSPVVGGGRPQNLQIPSYQQPPQQQTRSPQHISPTAEYSGAYPLHQTQSQSPHSQHSPSNVSPKSGQQQYGQQQQQQQNNQYGQPAQYQPSPRHNQTAPLPQYGPSGQQGQHQYNNNMNNNSQYGAQQHSSRPPQQQYMGHGGQGQLTNMSPYGQGGQSSYGHQNNHNSHHLPHHMSPHYPSPQHTPLPEVFLALDDTVYQVQFKRQFLYFVYRVAHNPQRLEFGDFVITECDRGVDLGVIVDILNVQEFQEIRHRDRKQTDEEVYRVRNILRQATKQERDLLPEKYHDEHTVMQHCIEVAQHIFMLPMNIVAAEYQFDRTKLSVYYTSNVRIDFRELVKNVFSTFQTRIWMKKSNREMSFEPKKFAVLALSTGVHFNQSSGMGENLLPVSNGYMQQQGLHQGLQGGAHMGLQQHQPSHMSLSLPQQMHSSPMHQPLHQQHHPLLQQQPLQLQHTQSHQSLLSPQGLGQLSPLQSSMSSSMQTLLPPYQQQQQLQPFHQQPLQQLQQQPQYSPFQPQVVGLGRHMN